MRLSHASICQWLPITRRLGGSPASTLLVRRVSSLSAIHRGLRRSRTAGSQAVGRDPEVAEHVTERRRARLAAVKPTHKIRRGKKDITETFRPEPTGKSASFYNVDDPFGKNSAVYKFKTGQLQEELEGLRKQKQSRDGDDGQSRGADRGSAWSRLEELSDSTGGRELPRRPGRPRRGDNSTAPRFRHSSQDGLSRGRREAFPRGERSEPFPRREHSEPFPRRERSEPFPRRQHSDSFPRREYSDPYSRREHSGPFPRRHDRSEPSTRRYEPSERHDGAGDRASRSSVSGGGLNSLPFTTAASQFLYGKSVVEAALKTGRRKLYKLYIYGGPNRQNLAQDQAVENLAKKIGLETTILTERDQRLMDKVCQGRPHNGYILEASPLPQLPVTALGELSEVDEFPGFGISLGHQSQEESQVNGTDNFVPTRPGQHRPLVLFLDGVRDPGNLGAILRSASFLGVSAVAISNRTSTTLTPVALKASAGASETMTLFSVDSPADFLARSGEAGWKIFAAVPTASRHRPGTQMDLRDLEKEDPLAQDPCILLVGSEGDGIPRVLRSKADVEVTIPNHSGSPLVDSLNVSVAAGLLCSSFVKGKLSRVSPAKDELGLWGV